MQRRKYLAALGSLAAGGAAMTGTGAFASVRAERNLNVSTAGDLSAYLGLKPTSEYTNLDNGKLNIEFSGGNGEGGQGLNKNADTLFANVFKIVNQGTNTIRVQLGDDDDQSSLIGSLPDGPMAVFYSFSGLSSPNVSNFTPFDASPAPSYYPSSDVTNQDLSPGDEMYVHMGFYLNADTQELGGASTNIVDVPDDIGIYADSTPDSDGL
ncbi:DUF1102 domain-containing protein [Halogeometricum rufum]|uniref:DUF1102 domain-containing protein n=1 Tax=Halogeometricum rufum TaxID=553469 RepID=UPI0011608193|nr:DUF1102 domain-containing protein [Halogeometricum rufum]